MQRQIVAESFLMNLFDKLFVLCYKCLISKYETNFVSSVLQPRLVTALKRDVRASLSTSKSNACIFFWHSLTLLNNLVS